MLINHFIHIKLFFCKKHITPIINVIFAQKNTYTMVDALDIKIIELLKVNSRSSYVDIGREVGLTASSVRERIIRLEDTGVIKKYSIVIDHSKLGYNLQAFVLMNLFPGNLKTFLAIIKTFKEVHECYRITGAQNLQLKVLLRDQNRLTEFLDKLSVYGDTTTLLILTEV